MAEENGNNLLPSMYAVMRIDRGWTVHDVASKMNAVFDSRNYDEDQLRYWKQVLNMRDGIKFTVQAVNKFENTLKASQLFLGVWAEAFGVTYQEAFHMNDDCGGVQVGKAHSHRARDLAEKLTELRGRSY